MGSKHGKPVSKFWALKAATASSPVCKEQGAQHQKLITADTVSHFLEDEIEKILKYLTLDYNIAPRKYILVT